jgi:hypothetical protein
MKKSIFTLCLITIIFTYKLYSQNWCQPGAMWHYSSTNFGGPDDFISISYAGDTVINGISCKKLIKSKWLCDARLNIDFTYDSAGIVYFYHPDLNQFSPLYNWNANPGDSTVFTIGNTTFQYDYFVSHIDSVKNDTINGQVLKHFYVHYTTNYNSTNWYAIPDVSEWIEGIGDINAMFPFAYGLCDGSWAGGIRCFSDSTIGLIDFDPQLECDEIINSVSETDHSELFMIFPNPATDLLNIYAVENFVNSTISIFSSDGKKMLTVCQDHSSISIKNFPRGLYLLKSVTDQRVITRKFLKH